MGDAKGGLIGVIADEVRHACPLQLRHDVQQYLRQSAFTSSHTCNLDTGYCNRVSAGWCG